MKLYHKQRILFLITATLFCVTVVAQSKQTVIAKDRWNMFGPLRLHIQDFAVTDKYTDTANGKIDGRFLDLSTLHFGIGFYQNFSRKLAMSAELMFGYGYMSKKNPTTEDQQKKWTQTIRTDLYYHFYNKEMDLQPYLFAGIHGTYKMGNIYMSSPVGIGAKYMICNNNAMITAQVGYGIGLTNGIKNSVVYTTGFYLNMKKNK